MRTDGRIGLIILAVGLAPALIKKSKPMARYVGDQLIRAGEYLKHGTEAPPVVVVAPPAASPSSASEPIPDAEFTDEPTPATEPEPPAESDLIEG